MTTVRRTSFYKLLPFFASFLIFCLVHAQAFGQNNDGDSVPDTTIFDDDNDGILVTVECSNNANWLYPSSSSAPSMTAVTDSGLTTATISFSKSVESPKFYFAHISGEVACRGAAINYIVKQVIDAKRLVAIGYGESIAKNKYKDLVHCTKLKYRYNRNTEIKYEDNGPQKIDHTNYKQKWA